MRNYLIVFIVLFSSCSGKVPFSLGDNFYLDYDRNGSWAVVEIDDKFKGTSGTIIASEIVAINTDSNYIIALVKPIDEITKEIELQRESNYSELKIKISNSKLRHYWIVDKKTTPKLLKDNGGTSYYSTYTTYGPFNNEEFIKKSEEIGVPRSLKLLTIEKFLDNQ